MQRLSKKHILNKNHKSQKLTLEEIYGLLYAAASGILFGCIGYFGIKAVEAGVSISNMLFWRFFIASIIVYFITLKTKKTKITFNNDLLMTFGIGGLVYSGATIFYFIACQSIGTGIAMVIFFTYPIFVVAFAWLIYKKPINSTHYISILLVIVGLLFITDLNSTKLDIYGTILSFLSALLYAVYIAFSKNQTEHTSPLLLTLALCAGCSLIFFIYSCINHSIGLPNNVEAWGHIIGIAIFGTTLPILFFLQALKYICSARASIISVLEPIVVVILGAALLGETLTVLQILGIVVMLSGVAFFLKFAN